MAINSRFAIAIHILTMLNDDNQEPKTSEYLADSVNTNPVFIRRIMGGLRKAGLVDSQPGAGGGAFLARPPDQINLLDIYKAVEEEQLFSLHTHQPNQYCPCGENIQPILQGVFGKAEVALEQSLAETTLAQIKQAVFSQDKLPKFTNR